MGGDQPGGLLQEPLGFSVGHSIGLLMPPQVTAAYRARAQGCRLAGMRLRGGVCECLSAWPVAPGPAPGKGALLAAYSNRASTSFRR